ncbi:hypothetical protein [Agrobacterium sp. LMR679]|uniref:hypothetical protein n=1 Tax=Agrobacterium sp. LMR679 TaxID=3014335 RepID=UPI0022AF46D7|nr:hypothetical protein [Agrobacterium sp. LMR679]MCZ4072752.1 hypothetical protein [Agrobacterium sp. LMR679]
MTEVMGYATKTAAVLAMREQGKRISDIAKILGISENAASGLESCAKRARNRSAKKVSATGSTVADLIPLSARQRLRPHAARREISTDRLIANLVIAIADGNLVDAVLDDGVK